MLSMLMMVKIDLDNELSDEILAKIAYTWLNAKDRRGMNEVVNGELYDEVERLLKEPIADDEKSEDDSDGYDDDEEEDGNWK